jgi:multiple sugar transport system ATP-binding protein
MARVTVDSITHRYRDGNGNATVAVEDFDVEIDDGEFIVLVGPSGCGKSTTLEILSGLLAPSEGRILFGDEDVTDQPARSRDIAMVFQSYALYPHMTVKENMAFPLKQRQGKSGSEAAARVEEAAEMMGIDDLLQRRPADLSGGQKQRVALGRAIVRDPDVFLMDEPLSNLDAKLRREMRVELQDLHAKLGTTTIYVTHNQEEAMTMADRIIILNHGEIQQIGAPQTVYEEPANRFVADFIGEPSMNFFAGEATTEGESAVFRFADCDASVTVATTSTQVGESTLGIRPEDIEIVDEGTGDITGRVRLIEPMGSHYEAHVTLPSDDDAIAELSTDTDVAMGDDVDLQFSRDALHLFDGRTGERLTTQPAKPTP